MGNPRRKHVVLNRISSLLSVGPALALVGGLIFGPLLLLLRVSLYSPAAGRGFYVPGTYSFANYAAFSGSHLLNILGFTILCGFAVATIVLAIAYPLGLFLCSLSHRAQLTAMGLILLPKTAGLLALLFGLQRWLPRGTLAVIVAEVYLVLPYSVLVIYIQLANLDVTLHDAACGLGANRWQAFRRVTWPLSRPGIILAFQLALMWGLGAFLGPLFLGGPRETTMAVELHRQAFEYGRWPLAAAEAIGLLILVTIASLGIPTVAHLRKASQ